jgi:carbon storage regulator
MLVLSRKRFESVWVGENVRITVLKLEGGHVRLGIEAPADVTVLRSELAEAQHREPGSPLARIRSERLTTV